jgi:hypothetical protein
MSIFLFIWASIAAFYGLMVVIASKSAVHEIEAGVAFLIATVAFGCAAIIEAVKKTNTPVQSPETARKAESRSSLLDEITTYSSTRKLFFFAVGVLLAMIAIYFGTNRP